MTILIAAVVAVAIVLIARISVAIPVRGAGAPFVRTSRLERASLLRWAGLHRDDTFAELGCGDGVVLQVALQEFAVTHASGVDIAPLPLAVARLRLRRFGSRVTLEHGTMLERCPRASFYYAYLSPQLITSVACEAWDSSHDGARFLSLTFPINTAVAEGWTLVDSSVIGRYTAYLYARKEKVPSVTEP